MRERIIDMIDRGFESIYGMADKLQEIDYKPEHCSRNMLCNDGLGCGYSRCPAHPYKQFNTFVNKRRIES